MFAFFFVVAPLRLRHLCDRLFVCFSKQLFSRQSAAGYQNIFAHSQCGWFEAKKDIWRTRSAAAAAGWTVCPSDT